MGCETAVYMHEQLFSEYIPKGNGIIVESPGINFYLYIIAIDANQKFQMITYRNIHLQIHGFINSTLSNIIMGDIDFTRYAGIAQLYVAVI